MPFMIRCTPHDAQPRDKRMAYLVDHDLVKFFLADSKDVLALYLQGPQTIPTSVHTATFVFNLAQFPDLKKLCNSTWPLKAVGIVSTPMNRVDHLCGKRQATRS
ncbi:hypothetical protein VFPPC_15982 [Pochonia chlamydosporia 170]|uniref:Uncharacterized protein n=1 Tax=Pochonia chlamydosporia 170 TaxID=1380566 RepID=A0A179FKC8_METCM|nr:hypothetical protein VFPPC_15982 [Pochonia chlamydosporia 170]OAQ66076.1 hypothetical protein VFPPC_15982 [Pochonia chlamydosporia 170]